MEVVGCVEGRRFEIWLPNAAAEWRPAAAVAGPEDRGGEGFICKISVMDFKCAVALKTTKPYTQNPSMRTSFVHDTE